MIYILNIESATTMCSVSISANGELVGFKEINNGYTHAENLHVFIDEILKAADISIQQLNAIAVSRGPGSYTGLRIGVSAAKGLAYARSLPLISTDTLQAMSLAANKLVGAEGYYCPMIDARRMEVYCGIYNHTMQAQTQTEALVLTEESIGKFKLYAPLFFFGNGMSKSKELLSSLPNAQFIENIEPSARFMSELSYYKYQNKLFEDLAYFEPFYLKDFLIQKKKI